MPRLRQPAVLRSDTLHGRLLLMVRDMQPEERIPSVRDLMRRYAVSQVTIDRALGRLKSDGYIAAQPGRGIFATGKRRLGTIGLVLNESLGHMEMQALKHARRIIGEAGYEVRLATFHVDQGVLPALRDLACDGLIVLPSSRRQVLAELAQARPASTPTVVLDLIPEDLELNAVATDNDYGGALAAKHLLELGHRRLALVLSEPDVESRRARVAGFTRHAELAGGVQVEVIDCLAMAQQKPFVPGGTYAVAHAGIAQLLRERGGPGFTAAFADSDMGALGMMKALHEGGIAMPGQVSVVGFDDLPEARYFHPALTTVRQDLAAWLAEALRIIEARLGGDAGPARRVRIRPELQVRESTGPAPGRA